MTTPCALVAKKCIEACTFGVLEWFKDRPIVVNPSSCSVCLECKLNCPADAACMQIAPDIDLFLMTTGEDGIPIIVQP